MLALIKTSVKMDGTKPFAGGFKCWVYFQITRQSTPTFVWDKMWFFFSLIFPEVPSKMGERLGFEQASKRIILGSICRFSWTSRKYLFLYKKKFEYWIRFQPWPQISWEIERQRTGIYLCAITWCLDLRMCPVNWSSLERWGHFFL